MSNPSDVYFYLRKHSVLDPATGCRDWTRGTSSQGDYPSMWIDNTCRSAHRVAYALRNPLPPGSIRHESRSVEIHHRCENKLCIEPSHLIAVTKRDHAAEHREARKLCRLAKAA